MPAVDPAVERMRKLGFARDMRKAPTEAERLMWSLLRDRRLAEFKFRRQQVMGRYIADFVCYDAKLVVELDGGQHSDNPTDRIRDAELVRRGFRVLRVWNNELTHNRAGVLEAIVAAFSGTAPPSSGLRPPSPIEGEGLTATWETPT